MLFTVSYRKINSLNIRGLSWIVQQDPNGMLKFKMATKD